MSLDMAHDVAHRFAACGIAVVTSVLGAVAQSDVDPTVGQIGVGTSIIGASYLIITIIREGSPPLQKMIETMATARNDRVRLEAKIEHLQATHDEDAARITHLEAGLARAENEAREAKNLLENAKIEADARTKAIEQRAREAGHIARNNSQRIQNLEQAVSGSSGEIPINPESVT
jgi:hypothetical protein